MSWAFLLFGLAATALGAWMILNPDQAVKVVQSAQTRGGIGAWDHDEPQMQQRNELGLWTKLGDRARAMRSVGVVAIVVGLGLATAAVLGIAN